MGAVDLERLALAQALYKKVGEYVSTKGSSLRSAADANLMEMFEDDGIDRQRIRINGVEVGTLGISFTKEHTERKMVVDDEGELVEYALDDVAGLTAFLCDNAQALADWYMQEGTVPDGCHVHLRGVPKEPKGTVLRVDPDKVAKAYGMNLPDAVYGLLEG